MTAPISNAILAGEDFAVALDKAIEQERDKAAVASLKVARTMLVEMVIERLDGVLQRKQEKRADKNARAKEQKVR